MSNISVSYSKLGMHEEALAIKEEALKFYRRVLPENHPDIGEGQERVLEFMQQPEEDEEARQDERHVSCAPLLLCPVKSRKGR